MTSAHAVADFRGLMLGLEHRYYGCHNASSCPTNVSKPDMKFLSSHQALEDLKAFRDYAVAAFGLRADVAWILIGGSYPGMLAAFGRAMYPDRFAMAVASSAPVHAKFDMNEYWDTASMAYAMSVEGVVGSPACYDAIKDGHATVKDLFATADGRAEVRLEAQNRKPIACVSFAPLHCSTALPSTSFTKLCRFAVRLGSSRPCSTARASTRRGSPTQPTSSAWRAKASRTSPRSPTTHAAPRQPAASPRFVR